MSRITWFPGHMAAAFKQLQRVIKGVDLVLEVRDARVPLSSANPKLNQLLAGKRHLVVLSKADLVPPQARQDALRWLEQQGLRGLPAACGSGASAGRVLRAAVDWLQAERPAAPLSVCMVLGLPNAGKSSLINALKLAANRAGALGGEQAFQKTARVGATPGLTRQVAGFQVAAGTSPTYILDSPGIMLPALPEDAAGFRLALAGAIKDSIVGEEALVKFYLHLLASSPAHRAALARSGRAQPQQQRPQQQRPAAPGKARQLAALRAALLAAADLGQGAAGAGAGAPSDSDTGAWDPGQDDAASGDASDARLHAFLAAMGVAGLRDPSRQRGALLRCLKALRAGQLGQYMFDDLPC